MARSDIIALLGVWEVVILPQIKGNLYKLIP